MGNEASAAINDRGSRRSQARILRERSKWAGITVLHRATVVTTASPNCLPL
jgi:hypothetical protein